MDIIFQDVSYLYQKGTPFERKALYHITSTIPSGTFLAVIGHTGSGKSTLIQHINGLLRPSAGTVSVGDYTLSNKKTDLKPLRKRVGIVFQYPEHQLFEETVEKDICFGPLNFGISEKDAQKRAHAVLQQVGLEESYLDRSPFELSGGQKRRVAIAGVLVMKPDVLILDEPTAGLDPRGRKEIMELFYRIHQERKITTILVTHSMEDAAAYADEILVMEKGKTLLHGTPDKVFAEAETLKKIGLDIPETLQFQRKLEERLGISLPSSCLTRKQLVNEVYRALQKK